MRALRASEEPLIEIRLAGIRLAEVCRREGGYVSRDGVPLGISLEHVARRLAQQHLAKLDADAAALRKALEAPPVDPALGLSPGSVVEYRRPGGTLYLAEVTAIDLTRARGPFRLRPLSVRGRPVAGRPFWASANNIRRVHAVAAALTQVSK